MLNLARKYAPFNNLLKNVQPTEFNLNEEERTAVDDWKSNVINPSILALPKKDAPHCNRDRRMQRTKWTGPSAASAKRPNNIRPKWMLVADVNQSRENCDIMQQECLAIALAVLLPELYIEGNSLVVSSDDQALRWIPDLKES